MNTKFGLTYRFEISNTLARNHALLRTEETFLLKDEAGADENATCNGQDDADNLQRYMRGKSVKLGGEWNCLEVPGY